MDKKLVARMLDADPRIAQAKVCLLETVKEYQSAIKQILPPDESLKQRYQEVIQNFSHQRGAHLYYPYLGSGVGRGPFVELEDGSVKYDFISGIGVHYFGHSHPDILSASIDASFSDVVMQGNLQQNKDAALLTDLLCKQSGLEHCFLTTSGAMANENALKLAFQKKQPASRILAFERTFSGRTLVMSQITDKPYFRQGLPSNVFVDYIPFFDSSRPEESTHQSLIMLKKHLLRYPKQHAAILVELVQGEAGFYVGSKEFFKSIFSLLREHGVAIIIDEVQTFGRTSELFAFQTFELEEFADIVTIGKLSLACATLFTKEYAPVGSLLSQTFISSTAAIRVGKVIIEKLLSEGFFGKDGKNRQIENHFHQKLSSLAEHVPHLVKGPFGMGTMVAFTLFEGDENKVSAFAQNLFEAGVIGFIAGSHPMRFRFLVPAGAVEIEDIDRVVHIIEETLYL